MSAYHFIPPCRHVHSLLKLIIFQGEWSLHFLNIVILIMTSSGKKIIFLLQSVLFPENGNETIFD